MGREEKNSSGRYTTLGGAAANNEVPRYHHCSATTRVCAPSKIFEALSGEATFELSRVLESLSRPYQRNKKPVGGLEFVEQKLDLVEQKAEPQLFP
jgi:hypothetical protein